MVDRCILTPSVTMPAPAAASGTGLSAQTTAEGRPLLTLDVAHQGHAQEWHTTMATLELPFPRTIPAWDPRTPIRDIFAPFSDGDAADKRHPRSPGGGDAGKASCADFVARHHLDAVLVQESLKIAILDGVWVRMGESIDGCVLTEIVGHKVRFRCRDGDTSLALSP